MFPIDLMIRLCEVILGGLVLLLRLASGVDSGVRRIVLVLVGLLKIPLIVMLLFFFLGLVLLRLDL
jgi:hypothetical protein